MKKQDKSSRLVPVLIIAVLGLWAVAIGTYLGQQGVFHKGARKSPGKALPQGSWDRERWMGMYQGDTKVGYAHSRLRAVEGGYQLFSNTRIKLSMLETSQEISMDLQARLDKDYRLEQVEFEAISGFMEIRARGEVEDGELRMKINTGGDEFEKELRFDKAPTLELEWMLSQAMADAGPGDKYEFSVFEPMSQKDLPVTVEVLGGESVELGREIVPCWKTEVSLAGQTEYAWIRKGDREVIKEYHPATGFTTVLEEREQALSVDWEKAGSVDIVTSLMVPSNVDIYRPRSVKYMRARLVDAPLSGLDTNLAGRQLMEGRTIEVRMEGGLPAEGYALPIQESLPEKAKELSEWLLPTAFIQSRHPRIKEAARQALSGAGDAVAAVERLMSWMGREMQPSMVVSIPSALEVLSKKRGACKEHTVLFIAMARASGIPARTASGIVYSDRQMIDGFYYHAWPEVYIAGPSGGGAWVAVDPTFRQFPADATHVKLTQGGLDKMLALGRVIGRLKVEVEEYR